MANSPTSELAESSQRDAFHAELDMALNIMKFASVASDPDLARYVHGKARESYQRLAKLSAQSRSEHIAVGALQALQQRLAEFQAASAAAK
jgi:hypothetical protein